MFLIPVLALILCYLNAIVFYILTQPGELLQKYARFINYESNLKPLQKKLLTCPYCLFTWLYIIAMTILVLINKIDFITYAIVLAFGVPGLIVTVFLSITKIKRFING